MICTQFSYIEYVSRIHLVKILLIFIKHELRTVRSKGLAHGRFFLTQTWWKITIFHKFEKPSRDLRNTRNTHTSTWKNTGPSRAKLYVTRRAVVSRVIQVQRRYAVQRRPMESVAWAHFRQIFDLFIDLYMICRYCSYIEYVLGFI